MEFRRFQESGQRNNTLTTLYHQWGQLYADLKRQHASVHNNSTILQLEGQIANEEAELRKRLGITSRFDSVPLYRQNAFRSERDTIAQVRDRLQSSITMLMQGKVTSMYRQEVLTAAAKELTGNGISYACIFSGPKGVAVVEGAEGDVHADIRTKVWGSGDEGSVRPPVASALLFRVSGKSFVVLENDTAAGLLWPSKFYGEQTDCITAPIIATDTDMVSRISEVFGDSKSIAKDLNKSSQESAVILTQDLQPIALLDNSMQTRRSAKPRFN